MQSVLKTADFDQDRADRFAGDLLATINRGALALMISVGHRTGLFDTLAGVDWVSSRELADAAGLNERYVREWLGAMAAGGMVETTAQGRFRLPPEHAAFTTRAAAENNLSVFAQYIATLGSVEDDVVGCFRTGGGVSYERYARFHEIMAEDSGQSVLPVIESHVIALVPGLKERLESGIRVLDAGCGRGLAAMKLAERFPNSRFRGVDLSTEAIAWATTEATRRGLTNVAFVAADLSDFDRTAAAEHYDLVFTFDAVHDQARPANLLRGIRRTLKRDGVYIMQDIHAHSHVHDNLDNPMAPLLYTVSCMHCMTVSLAQGGEGLGAMWGRELAKAMLYEAGFKDIEVRRFDHDIQNDWYVVRKQARGDAR